MITGTAALITFGVGCWGLFEVAQDMIADHRRGPVKLGQRCGDVVWLLMFGCLIVAALT